MLTIIFFSSTALLIFGILIGLYWFRYAYAPSSYRAWILLKSGTLVRRIKGHCQLKDGTSNVYHFKPTLFSKQDTVTLPDNYPIYTDPVSGRRLIAAVEGRCIAEPLFSDLIIASPKESVVCSQFVTSMLESDIGVKMAKSVKAKQGFPWLWIIIIAIIALVAFFAYKYFFGNPPIPPANPTDKIGAILPW